MYENQYDEMAQVNNPEAMHEFIGAAGAAMVGGYVGHKIDQTRFGVWVNTSPTINKITLAFKRLLVLAIAGLAVYFIFFCLLPQF